MIAAFFLGLFVGGFIGMFAMALAIAADEDRGADRKNSQMYHESSDSEPGGWDDEPGDLGPLGSWKP